MDLSKYFDLVSCDFKNKTQEQILEAFNAFMPTHVFFGLPPSTYVLPMLRGRIWNQIGLPLKIRQCSYNPTTEYYGRCHIPGRPVFYGSEVVLPIVLDEIEARRGDYIIVGKWDFEVDNKVKIAPLIYGLNIQNEIVKKFQGEMDDVIKKHYHDNPHAAESFGLHLKIFNNLFHSNNIELTGTIAHNMIYGNKIFSRTYHCLIYSSVASHGSGNNFAIDISLCDEQKVKPRKFYLYRYIETKPVAEGYYVLTPLYVGYPDLISGNISWQEYEERKHKEGILEDTHYKISA